MPGAPHQMMPLDPQCTAVGHRARISALAEFADAAWGLPEQQLIALLLGGVASFVGIEGTEAMEALAEAAWQTFDRERGKADPEQEPSWDPEFEAAVLTYVDGIMSLAVAAGEDCRQANARVHRGQALMGFAARLYLEFAGPCPGRIAADLLADLQHWCAERGARMPRAA